VFASRTLTPATTTVKPTVVTRTVVATVRERPAARETVAEKPAAQPAEDERDEVRLAQRTWVPRVAEDRTTVYTGRRTGSGDLKARAERINARARDERMFPSEDTVIN
jgi:hypothetical protein